MPFRALQNTGEIRSYEVLIGGESIASATWVSVPSSVINGQELFSDGPAGGARCLFGPVARGRYTLTCHLIATSGQEFDRDIVVEVTRL